MIIKKGDYVHITPAGITGWNIKKNNEQIIINDETSKTGIEVHDELKERFKYSHLEDIIDFSCLGFKYLGKNVFEEISTKTKVLCPSSNIVVFREEDMEKEEATLEDANKDFETLEITPISSYEEYCEKEKLAGNQTPTKEDYIRYLNKIKILLIKYPMVMSKHSKDQITSLIEGDGYPPYDQSKQQVKSNTRILMNQVLIKEAKSKTETAIAYIDQLRAKEKDISEKVDMEEQKEYEEYSQQIEEERKQAVASARVRFNKHNPIWRLLNRKINPDRIDMSLLDTSEIDNLYVRGRR